MTLSARSAIAANSGERGENSPGYHRNTGRSGMRSGPARLSRCLAGRTFGVYRHLLGADLRAAATPDVAEGREPHVHVRLALGVSDKDHGPRGVAARQLRDRAVISCADSSSVTTIRLSTLERRASVPSSFVRSLPSSRSICPTLILPPPGAWRASPITASSTPSRPAREARRPPPVPRSRQDRTIPPASVTSASSRGRVSSRRLRPRRPG